MNYYKENFKNIFEKEYTWAEGFMRNVRRFSKKDAMIFPETNEKWTYEELNDEANRFSNVLKQIGAKKSDVVMCMLENSPVFAFSYVACHKSAMVHSPINYRLSAGEIALSIDDAKPIVFLFPKGYEETVKEAFEMANHTPKTAILVDVYKKSQSTNDYVTYEDFVKDALREETVNDYEIDIYDETTRLYTSGTTGKQKGVPLNSINEVLSAHDIMIHFPMNYTDVTMNTTPWFHRGGIHCGGPTPTFYAGASLVIMRKFDAKLCLEYIEKYNLSYIVGVPAVLEQLAQMQQKQGYNLSSLRGIVTMGSPLERSACIRYQELLTPNIFNGYGTTESLWNTFLRPFNLPENAGTAGGACVDDDVRVVKIYEDKKASPDDIVATDNIQVGEVIIKSPAKSPYMYYNNDEETKRKYANGFLYTNDLATWDENKFITICGRKDDMIISSGENIYPTQVEECLNMHPKVKECIVTAAPDKSRGEVVTAYIVKEDESLTYEELEQYMKESTRIANYKRPRYYRFISEIPLNMTGKKLHYKAKEMAKEDLINGLLYRI